VTVSWGVREDLHGLQRVVSIMGAIRYQALESEDGHSDRATALALALHAGREWKPTRPRVWLRSELQRRRRDRMIFG
jgi:hypothetical protein